MKAAFKGPGPIYLYTKAFIAKSKSYEDDLRSLLSQYQPTRDFLELFRATKIGRYLPGERGVIDPASLERAAYKYYTVVAREALEDSLTGSAVTIYDAYQSIVTARDVEIIARAALQGREVRLEELIAPEAPQVFMARRAGEETGDPSRVLRAAGMKRAAEIVARRRSSELVTVAVDIEVLGKFVQAYEEASTLTAKKLLGNRVDILAARTSFTLASLAPETEIMEAYEAVLETHMLPKDKVIEAMRNKDRESLERIFTEHIPGRIPEGFNALDALVFGLRRENRRLAKHVFIREVLTPETAAGLLELLLLDTEDAIAMALSSYSGQPREILANMVSFQ
ncbi:MAG: hypothetical protein DSY37_04295 [Hyperthermus sp.]|nr:MAG: hypothetical protein DSY37_04295 [Hyperthermus sp.]